MRFSDFLLVSDPTDLDFIVGYTDEQNIRINVLDLFAGQIIGGGTPGYVPVFTAENVIDDSVIFQHGTNIVIGGVNSLGYKLAINGSLYASNGAVINSTALGADALRVIAVDGDIFVIPNDSGQPISSLRRIAHPPAVLTTESATLGQLNTAISNLEEDIEILLDLKVDKSSVGEPNGVASLDATGKIPLSEIPDSIIGQVEYMGTWNAFTNTPTLNPLVPEQKGHYYVVSAAGVFGGVDYQVGDWIISNGVQWQKVDNTDAVTSVFGRIGAILALEADYQSFYPRLSQAYDNPTWINTLAFSKITGVPPFLLENQTITLSGDVTGSGKTSIVSTISNNSVTDSKLRDSVGTSVIGRASSTTGDPADIQASTDGYVLQRSGGTLLFGLISSDSIGSIDWSKIINTPTTLSGYGITNAYTKTESDNKFIPYTGANANVNLGSNNITANAFVKVGGTSSQFLKADGSVDVSQYVPTTRSVNAGTGLTGGGNLSSDVTLSFDTTWGDTRYAYRTRQLTINGTTYDLSADRTWNVGTVTSVGLSMPPAFTVSNSPITSSGTIAVTAAGNATQYIRGDGSLADFPGGGGGGGGASVSYYLNGSVNQGTFGGNTYYEFNKTPILGAGTDFNISSDGYIAQFITDAGDPNLLEIPAGNWNFETYFSASSGGGTPSFYIELYKYDGTTFTLIASSSAAPELIAFGTIINPYFSALAVPQTSLLTTDRLAIRIYVNTSGRTITLHTENNHLCQVITTFTTGLTALNGLTAQVQYFQTGTSGTDFNILSSVATHTFNLPTASAVNRGALSAADWSTFNNKQATISLTTTGNSGVSTFIANVLNVPNYTLSGLGGVPTSRTLTINGVGLDLSTDRSWSVGTVTSVTASSPLASSGGTTPNITIQQASGSQNGFLSSTDWTTFNNKQNALTNPVTGTGTINTVPKFTGLTTIGNSAISDTDTEVNITKRVFITSGVHQFVFIPNLSSASNRIETIGGLPFQISTDGGSIGLNVGGGSSQFSMTNTSASFFIPVTSNGQASTSPAFIANNGVGASGTAQHYINFTAGTTTIARMLRGNGASGLVANGLNIDNFDGFGVRLNQLGGSGGSFNITGGNVGIGTTDPTSTFNARLAVRNEDAANNPTLVLFKNINSASSEDIFRVQSWNGAFNTVASIRANGSATFSSTLRATEITASMPSGNGALYINNSSLTNKNWTFIPQTSGGETDLLLFYTGASAGTRLTVTNSGNVGIGTSTPTPFLNANARTLAIDSSGTNPAELAITGQNANVYLGNGGLAAYLYSTGSYPLIFGTNGAERMRITSSGNVGIGTNNPEARTVIATTLASSASFNWLTFRNLSGGYGTWGFVKQGLNGLSLNYGTDSDTPNVGSAITFAYGGNVGIGTSSPTNLTGYTTLSINNSTFGSIFEVMYGGTPYGRFFANTNTSVVLTAITSIPLVFATNDTERMRITSGGNLLVGTTTDNGARLQVSGGITALNSLVVTSSSNAALIASTNSTTGFSYLDFINSGASGRNYQIGVAGNGASSGYANNLYFDLVGVANIMTLTSGRNVLIGTQTDNGARLQVSGGIFTSLSNGVIIVRDNGTSQVEVNVRHTSTRDGVVSFTQDGVADRWAIGTKPSDGTLYFSANFNLSTPRFTLTNAGAATFSSSVTATRLITTNGQNTLANSSNLSYIGKGDNTFFSGFNFQGISVSDMFFGRAANSDDLIISQSGIVSPREIIRFTQGGNVGIGTSSPLALLTVGDGATQQQPYLALSRNSLGGFWAGIRWYDGNTIKSVIQEDSDFNLRFSTSNTERMRITSGGKVLIGTTSNDGAMLQVAGTGGSFGDTVQFYNTSTNGAFKNTVNIGDDRLATWGLILGKSGINTPNSGYHAPNGAHIVNVQNGPIRFGTNNTERMEISSSGNVLIGTTTDSGERLQVRNGMILAELASGSNGAIIKMGRSAGAYYWSLGIDSSASDFNFYNNSGTSVARITTSGTLISATGVYDTTSATNHWIARVRGNDRIIADNTGYVYMPFLTTGSGIDDLGWWGASGGSWTYNGMLMRISSSARYKKNIRDIEIDTSKIYDLRTISYENNEFTAVDGLTSFGLLAEDVAEKIPLLATFNNEGQPEGVQYKMLSVLLLEELKKLKQEIDTLKNA